MARVWSCALLLVAALVCRPVTGHNNPTVWTGECDPAANQNKGAWSLVAGVNVTGAGFPFVNITGSCFGSESHLLDPESTILVIENVDANDFKIERVTPTPVSYTHLRAHETPEHLVCRLLLEKKKKKN
eukprot:TRINITY_DN10222_c0_g1_i8.p1 TRINITY_DN10222_c0_g1~~TRINITY_DN10222_c0_g1_i8.p1  ORF type:complete len:129 (-),score=39.87 TRINITY_DN10222_c0_g1_i8:71-457(-)